MEKELGRLHKYENSFNQEFATNHNDYYNSVSTLLRKMRSHMSPLKNILKKFCPTKHPTAAQCATFDLPGKSVYENSLLSKGVCESNIFDLSTFPAVAQGLYQELKQFLRQKRNAWKFVRASLKKKRQYVTIRQEAGLHLTNTDEGHTSGWRIKSFSLMKMCCKISNPSHHPTASGQNTLQKKVSHRANFISTIVPTWIITSSSKP